MTKPYKVKHVPTGLYWQPHKHRGSHLSKNGKIYQTKANGVFDYYNIKNGIVRVSCLKDSRIYKLTINKIPWTPSTYDGSSMSGNTILTDWIIEELT